MRHHGLSSLGWRFMIFAFSWVSWVLSSSYPLLMAILLFYLDGYRALKKDSSPPPPSLFDHSCSYCYQHASPEYKYVARQHRGLLCSTFPGYSSASLRRQALTHPVVGEGAINKSYSPAFTLGACLRTTNLLARVLSQKRNAWLLYFSGKN